MILDLSERNYFVRGGDTSEWSYTLSKERQDATDF